MNSSYFSLILFQTSGPISLRLKTDLSKGLSQTEVKRRQNEFGLNIIAKQKQSSVLKIFLQQLNSLVVWVLLGAVAVSFYLHEETDAIVIFAIVILNIMIVSWATITSPPSGHSK